MEIMVGKGNCPHCGSASRTRMLPIVLNALKDRIPLSLVQSKSLLGFAMTSMERTVLNKVFPVLTSASLYGNYGKDHIEGCDMRDLSRFPDASFSGVFSILLFDYFIEIDAALAECARVTAPGGIFITYIANTRLVDGEMPPTVVKIIEKTETYFPYIPDNANMPSIKVGRETFVNAMKRVGYQAAHYSIQDDASGEKTDWFIGFLPTA
jgi:SAM-dependent methyltransferase